jgi:hypothetical protein
MIPVTADNLLLNPDGVYKPLRKRIQLQADAVRLNVNSLTVRDMYDVDIAEVEKMVFCHRPFKYWEAAADSNERELIAISYVIDSCVNIFSGNTVTLHTDNLNAATICTKGSNKPRLNKYAVKIALACRENSINLAVNWIPRDLNMIADNISNCQDFTDYTVTQEFFQLVSADIGVSPVIDLFANEANAKCPKFFSLTFCRNTCGVDAFNYNWCLYGLGWIFVPPPMILRAIHHLEITQAEALVLVPQWKTSYFYPRLRVLKDTDAFKAKLSYSGKDIFRRGNDIRSYFGPDFQANVEVWYLSFKCKH